MHKYETKQEKFIKIIKDKDHSNFICPYNNFKKCNGSFCMKFIPCNYENSETDEIWGYCDY